MIGTNDMRIAQEEIFGPVMTVIPYSGTDQDAVRIANDSIYGLAGGVVSASTSRAFNVGRQIRAGSVNTSGVGGAPIADLGPGGGQGPGWGTRHGRHRPDAARSAASSTAASAASGATTASRPSRS